jgi:hypothetical protein
VPPPPAAAVLLPPAAAGHFPPAVVLLLRVHIRMHSAPATKIICVSEVCFPDTCNGRSFKICIFLR